MSLDPAAAAELQRRLAPRVVTADAFAAPLETVAGADVGFRKGWARAAVVVLRLPDLTPVEEVVVEEPVASPYVPGLFSFRELPPLLRAFARLEGAPDVVLCDAHGRAHPRRFGMACHLGVSLDVPSVGCAKTVLVGAAEAPAPERGARADLVHAGEVVGAAVRTRTDVRPVYVSTGHRVALDTAVRLVLACARTRIPEPIRRADELTRG